MAYKQPKYIIPKGLTSIALIQKFTSVLCIRYYDISVTCRHGRMPVKTDSACKSLKPERIAQSPQKFVPSELVYYNL